MKVYVIWGKLVERRQLLGQLVGSQRRRQGIMLSGIFGKSAVRVGSEVT